MGSKSPCRVQLSSESDADDYGTGAIPTLNVQRPGTGQSCSSTSSCPSSKKKRSGGASTSAQSQPDVNARIDSLEARIGNLELIAKEILAYVKEIRQVMPRVYTGGPTGHFQSHHQGPVLGEP